jgi:hypothetical protein
LLCRTQADQPALYLDLWLAIPANDWEVVKIVNGTDSLNNVQFKADYGANHAWQGFQFNPLTYLKFAHLVTLSALLMW